MFYYAQKAVLHPTAALYNPDEKEVRKFVLNIVKKELKKDLNGCGINIIVLEDDQHFCSNLNGFSLQLTPKCKAALRRIFKVSCSFFSFPNISVLTKIIFPKVVHYVTF